MGNSKIPGGYYIKARKIKNSPVHKMPPHVREIWDYCLREANHSVGFMGPYRIERGQLFRSYLDIREDLSWYIGYRKMMYDENQTKKAMKALRDALMIETTKAPGGVLITVLNYDFYQDQKNYESTNESTNESTTKEPSKHQGSTTNNKNDKKNKNEKKKEYSEDSKEFRLSLLMFDKIISQDPKNKHALKAKADDFQKWCEDINKINRLDERTFEQIEYIVKWVYSDPFWCSKILGAAKLRDKFSDLVAEVKRKKSCQKNGNNQPSSRYQELD